MHVDFATMRDALASLPRLRDLSSNWTPPKTATPDAFAEFFASLGIRQYSVSAVERYLAPLHCGDAPPLADRLAVRLGRALHDFAAAVERDPEQRHYLTRRILGDAASVTDDGRLRVLCSHVAPQWVRDLVPHCREDVVTHAAFNGHPAIWLGTRDTVVVDVRGLLRGEVTR